MARDRVIMFADIVGSTVLYDSLGDREARALIRQRLQAVREIAAAQTGEVVVEIGDEVMCFFDTADAAAAAACEMHERMSESCKADGRDVQLRVGIHAGKLEGNADDLIGETAKLAQWAARHAKPEQTLLTRTVFESLPGVFQAVSRYVDDETWNFVSLAHMELYELVWDVEAVTAFKGETLPEIGNRYAEVRFVYAGTEYVVNEERPVISVGRHASNDIVITHDLVSRQHFSVQFSRGRCTITDNSTNGTFIVNDSQEKIPVRRETFPLVGAGRIYLGEPSEAKERYTIRFSCS